MNFRGILYIVLTGLLFASCTGQPTQWSVDLMQDPVVVAALNSREGQEAKLLIDSGNRFADCIDAYNAWISEAGRPIPEEIVEQTRMCRIQLEADKTETSEQASADIVTFHKSYHPTCNHIPSREELLRVEVSKMDMSTFASWTAPENIPSYEESTLLREALPLASCQEYIQKIFSVSVEEPLSLRP